MTKDSVLFAKQRHVPGSLLVLVEDEFLMWRDLTIDPVLLGVMAIFLSTRIGQISLGIPS